MKFLKIDKNRLKIKNYLNNLVLLLFMSLAFKLYDYFFTGDNNTLIEALGASFILFFILALLYTLISPTFWYWITNKLNKK